MELKIGDKVILPERMCSGGRTVIVTDIRKMGNGRTLYFDVLNSISGVVEDRNNCTNCNPSFEGVIILGEKQNNLIEKTMATLKNIYSKLTLVEPNKSRQATGIYDSDNLPTEDGLKVIAKWLLENNGNVADFDAKVVAPIVAEMEKEKK